MLLQFNFQNFKSFRDDTTLDMSAAPVTEFDHHIVKIGNEKVLPIAAIFGANASGKSNVIEAIHYMKTFVVYSFGFGGENATSDSGLGFISPPPFLFDATARDGESSFEVYFIASEEYGARLYNYGFTLNRDGVREEWLNDRAKTARGDYRRIFYRNEDEGVLDMPGLPRKSHENIRVALEKKALVVSLGAKLKIDLLKFVRDWFMDTAFADFGRPIMNYVLSTQLPQDFVSDKAVQDRVVKYFSSFDPSILGFEAQVIEEGINESAEKKIRIDAIHKMIGSDETGTIPLGEESAGTLKMFALFPLLEDVLQSGGVLFVDELNARLHPLMVRTFILTFLNPKINRHHAQLIFTTHDAWQLDNDLLRRDEIWFTEKDDDGVSSLYSLADFTGDGGAKIRKDENYLKNYMLGKYGAIPTMDHFRVLKEE
ncbi:MAG: ATP-binding protein [Oscillospiraceae bacterium]|nr:ATP-binding protein [Oscillospiraceae bacterium]